jgi:hypothetical protein
VDVYVSGSYAYIAAEGLRIIDISNPQSPNEVGYFDTPGYARDVHVSGSYAYVAAGGKEGLRIIDIRIIDIRIIDISNPQSPNEVGYFDTPGYARDVHVSGSYAYVAAGDYGGLCILRFMGALPPPSLTIASPNGGEVWVAGTVEEIRWTSTGEIENVRLEYSKDGFVNDINLIVEFTPNDGSYLWSVPHDPSTTVKMRISDAAAPEVVDTSDASFTIKVDTPPPTLNVYNFPNPFNKEKHEYTTIKVWLPKDAKRVYVKILDTATRYVWKWENSNLFGEYFIIKWYGKNDEGEDVASGIYTLVLEAHYVDGEVERAFNKILLIRKK